MTLPDSWVDRLFGRLAVRYGDAWLRKWDGLDMADVKADWAQRLAGLDAPERQHRLKHALEHLPPSFPPNASEFMALCEEAREPQPQLPSLPAPTEYQLHRLQDLRGRLHEAFAAPRDPRAWARRVIARHESRERCATPAALDMARSALAREHAAEALPFD